MKNIGGRPVVLSKNKAKNCGDKLNSILASSDVGEWFTPHEITMMEDVLYSMRKVEEYYERDIKPMLNVGV